MTYFQLLKTYPRSIGFGLLSAFFSAPGQTHMVALFSPFIMEKFAFSHTQYGSFYAGATLLSGLIIPFVGPLIDKKDIRWFAFAVGLGLVLSQWMLAFSHSTFWLFLSLFGLRFFGQGLCSHITSVGTARYFTANRGKALSLALLGYSLGEGTATPFLAHCLQTMEWTTVLLGSSTVVIAVFLPLSLWLTKDNPAYNRPLSEARTNGTQSKAPPPRSDQKQWTRGEVFRQRTIYIFLLLAMMPPFALTGIFFHQTAIGDLKNWSMTLMASGFVFFALTRFGFGFVGGPLVDRFKAIHVFPWTSIPMTLGFWVLAGFDQSWAPYLSFALFGISVGVGSTVKSSMWAELYGTLHLGAVRSSMTTIMVMSTASSPILFGYVIDQTKEIQPLLVTLGVVTLAFAALAWAHIRWSPKFSQRLSS